MTLRSGDIDMSTSTYIKNIKNNFTYFDGVLRKYENDSCVYRILFALRTTYCVITEIAQRQDFWAKSHNKKGVAGTIKALPGYGFLRRGAGVALRLTRQVFVKKSLSGKGGVVILGHLPDDEKVAAYLNVNRIVIVERHSFPFLNILLLGRALGILWALRSAGCLKKSGCGIESAIESILLYHQIDLTGIDVIITEDDIDFRHAIILQKAIEQGIKTIKIEHFLIDEVQHNNVLCEYYFYPSVFHKRVREKFPINQRLKYVEGGFINHDIIAKYEYLPQLSPKIILFITQHGGQFGARDELFYIDEILSLIAGDDYVVHIKVHPREQPERYAKYGNNDRCKVVSGRDVDNYELISRAYFCVSISSSLVLEAKLICNRSFFIKFDIDDDFDMVNLNDFSDFFDVVQSKRELGLVLSGAYGFKAREIYLKNYNMTYPDTKNRFVKFLDSITE